MAEFVISPIEDALTVDAGGDAGIETVNHTARALSRLVEQFKHQQPIIDWLEAVAGSCQPLEEAYQQLLLLRRIDTGEGEQLNVIGRIVGQPREGRDDAAYKPILRARVAANKSEGTIEDIVNICKLAVDSPDTHVIARSEPIASANVEVSSIAIDDDIADALIVLLRGAVKAGVRLLLVTSSFPIGETFRYDVGPGYDVGHYAAGRS